MRGMSIKTSMIRAGEANMFLSPIFREAFASLTGTVIELYNTDGSYGAARGAGVGLGFYKNFSEAFQSLNKTKTIEPDKELRTVYEDAYCKWIEELNKKISGFNQ
jgi:xylulokinase